jgi:hypothetical protein
VAALAIAVLISSTTLYVYEQDKAVESAGTRSLDGVVFALEQGVRNVLVSSLANVSGGGNRTILESDLRAFSSVARDSYGSTLSNISYSPFEDGNYESGFWLSWNTSSYDVSSVQAHFNLAVQAGSATVTRSLDVNVTMSVAMNASFSVVGQEKHVNLTVLINDEDCPAMAGSFLAFYNSGGNWTEIDAASLTTIDNGDGTYSLGFIVPIDATSICLRTSDLRGILVESVCPIA